MTAVSGLQLGIGLILVSASCAAAEPPDAAALVRQVRDREAWVERAESLQLKAEIRWERTSRGIEHQRQKLRKQFPDADLSTLRDLQPRVTSIVELAFDKTRVRLQDHRVGDSNDLRIWDGARFILYNRYDKSPDRNAYLINREPEKWLYWLLWTNLCCFRAGPHPFWWHGPKERAQMIALSGKPEDFFYEGRAEFHGSSCHVVNHRESWTSLYIACDDGLLRGLRSGALGTAKLTQSLIRLFQHNGHQVLDEKDLERVSTSTPGSELTAILRDSATRLTQLVDPVFEFWLDDEKEVAPGCWLPMTQGVRLFEVDEAKNPFECLRKELRILGVKVNEPLPDALFVIEFKEGERINDQTTDPPLSYRYKRNMTPAEWAAIIAEGKKRSEHDRDRVRKQAALIAREAPEFPVNATWLNGKPLTLKELAGKVVILDFWAEWCGPCRNDLPVLAALPEKRPKDVVVIGVHPPGGDLAKIRKAMDDFELEYPICIDVTRPQGTTAWGAFYGALDVNRIPHAVVIDGQGKVAATGALDDVLKKASELVGRPLSVSTPR